MKSKSLTTKRALPISHSVLRALGLLSSSGRSRHISFSQTKTLEKWCGLPRVAGLTSETLAPNGLSLTLRPTSRVSVLENHWAQSQGVDSSSRWEQRSCLGWSLALGSWPPSLSRAPQQTVGSQGGQGFFKVRTCSLGEKRG